MSKKKTIEQQHKEFFERERRAYEKRIPQAEEIFAAVEHSETGSEEPTQIPEHQSEGETQS